MKKLLIKKYVLALFFLVVVLKLISGFYLSKDSSGVHQGIERNKEIYMEYYSQMSGAFSEQKNQYIGEKRKQYDEVASKLEKIGTDYTFKRASSSEYTSFLMKNKEILKKSDMLEIVESQCSYVKEDMQKRYFIYYNGWANYFQHLGIDIFLLLLIIVISVPVFEFEIDTCMHQINRIAINGNAKLYWTKVLLATIISSICAITFLGIDLLVNEITFGLGNLDYPIQSIPIFEECQWNVSIGTVLIFSFAIRTIGAVSLSIIIMVLELLLRDTIYLVMVTVGILFLPILMIGEKQLYHLPLPSSFLSLKGYITGIFDIDAERWFISSGEMIKLFVFATFLCIIILITGYFLYEGRSIKKFHFSILFICSCLMTVACGKSVEKENLFIYNKDNKKVMFSNEKYVVDAAISPIKIQSKDRESDLIKDPFGSKANSDIIIQGIGDEWVYYLKIKNSSERLFEARAVHATTGEDKVLYKSELKLMDYDYLGLNDVNNIPNATESEQTLPTGFWVDENNIYLVTDYGIDCVDLRTRKRSEFVKDVYDSNVSYVDGNVFFIDNQRRLNILLMQSGVCERIGEYLVDHCFAIKNKVIFQTLESEVICYDLHTKKLRSYGKQFDYLKNVNEDDMYFIDDKNVISVYSLNSGELLKIFPMNQMVVAIDRGINKDEIRVAVEQEGTLQTIILMK